MANTNPPDAAQRAIFEMAMADGAFQDALEAYQQGQILRAVELLAGANYPVTLPSSDVSGREWATEMANGLDLAIESAGATANYKLAVAREFFASLANLQAKFERPYVADLHDPNELLAETILAAIRLGNAEATLAQTIGRVIDVHMALLQDRRRTHHDRQRGAMVKKEGDARRKLEALEVAREITSVNPTLSADDIATRLRDRVKSVSALTTRTLTEWIRHWRRDGDLPPRVAT